MRSIKLTKQLLESSEIIGKTIVHGRWELTIKIQESKVTFPQSHYNWLKANPSFESIPKDYVIHHLDLNPLNDDISNLVLFNRFHHNAYHLKFKNFSVPISLNRRDGFGDPTQRPTIRPSNGNGKSPRFLICYSRRASDGKSRQKKVYSWNGLSFKSRQDAEKVVSLLWPDKPWEFRIN